MSKTLDVFYIVATRAHDGREEEIGKFFAYTHAAAHIENIPKRNAVWNSYRIDQRVEALEDQHHAHGGKVGKP